jgi:hypothetical protein
MGRAWGLRLVLIGLVLAAAGASSDQDALDRNRRRLDKLRSDPVEYARLMHDLKAFFALPKERQKQIRDLDTQLHNLDLAKQARLWGVLERYSKWLDGLSPADRELVLDAPTPEDRLKIIRFLRDREWADRALPSVKVELGKLKTVEEKQKAIEKLRAEEREQRRKWDRSLPPPPNVAKPTAFHELPEPIQVFVLEELLPAVPEDRFAVLGAAEGRWPDYPRSILALTNAYLTYRPLPSGPIRSKADLPDALRRQINFMDKGGKLSPFWAVNQKQGWPEYALALEKVCREVRLKHPELGACRPAHYPAVTQAFIKQHLAEHATDLAKLEGQWPQYPERLEELARAKGLRIPGMTPPGPAALWDAAQAVK